MVGGHHHVGGLVQPQGLERGSQTPQIGRGVADGRQTGRSVDAGLEGIEAVALVMLGAVRIARPEHQHERPVRRLETRQDNVGGDLGEPVLLLDIGHMHAGHVVGARVAVQPPVRRSRR